MASHWKGIIIMQAILNKAFKFMITGQLASGWVQDNTE